MTRQYNFVITRARNNGMFSHIRTTGNVANMRVNRRLHIGGRGGEVIVVILSGAVGWEGCVANLMWQGCYDNTRGLAETQLRGVGADTILETGSGCKCSCFSSSVGLLSGLTFDVFVGTEAEADAVLSLNQCFWDSPVHDGLRASYTCTRTTHSYVAND